MNPKPKNNEETNMTEFKVNFAEFIKELEYHKRNRTPELYISVEVFENHDLTMVSRLSLLREIGLTEAITLIPARVSPDAQDIDLINSFKIKNNSCEEFKSVESALENAFTCFKKLTSYKEKSQ